MTDNRIIAQFTPQTWVNDYAITVDPEGETTYDVTDELLTWPLEDVLAIRDNDEESDRLIKAYNAPAWIANWAGPYYIEVQESLLAYLDAWRAEQTVQLIPNAILHNILCLWTDGTWTKTQYSFPAEYNPPNNALIRATVLTRLNPQRHDELLHACLAPK